MSPNTGPELGRPRGSIARLADWDYGLYTRLVGFFRSRTFVADWLLALVLTGLSVGGLYATHPLGTERHVDALGLTLAVAGHVPLAWRRRRPLGSLVIVAIATWAFWVFDYRSNFHSGLMVGIYSGIAHATNRRQAWLVSGGVAALSLAVIVAGIAANEDDVSFGTLLASLTLFGIAISMGDGIRNRRAYLHELEEKAERADADRIAEAERAAAAERTRIARELHDVVAHSMSVMVVQAGAARRVLDTDPEQATMALEHIEETGRDSLAEMRRVLGILRDPHESATLVPQPTLDEFDVLVEQCTDAGLDVELNVVGEARRLGAGVELAGFRIVQEALTNVLKHAGPAKVEVTLRYLAQQLDVEVVDDGRGASTGAASPSGGNGLLGMRERVELYGGVLQTGPQRGGGFRVHATIPLPQGDLARSMR